MPKEGPDHPPCERKILIAGLSSLSFKKSRIISFAFSVISNMVASLSTICQYLKI
jgi:hypothetical protein